jgi:chaperonin GroEL
MLRQKAEKAIRALPLALREGVVAGGGVAYVNCLPAVRAIDGDAKIAGKILARALQEPMRRLLSNAGIDAPAAVIAQAQQRGADFGCNVMTGDIVAMNDAGILDAVGVLREALQIAVSGAMMALTTDTIVLHQNPQTVYEP